MAWGRGGEGVGGGGGAGRAVLVSADSAPGQWHRTGQGAQCQTATSTS